MATQYEHANLKFWYWWVFASGLGAAIGWPVTLLVAFAVTDIAGIEMGRDLPGHGRSVYFGVPSPAVFWLSPFALMIGGAAGGLLAGGVHWLILRRHVSHAGWWVLVSVLAWAVAWAVHGRVDGVYFDRNNLAFDLRIVAVVGTFCGILLGSIIGGKLLLFWLRPPSRAQLKIIAVVGLVTVAILAVFAVATFADNQESDRRNRQTMDSLPLVPGSTSIDQISMNAGDIFHRRRAFQQSYIAGDGPMSVARFYLTELSARGWRLIDRLTYQYPVGLIALDFEKGDESLRIAVYTVPTDRGTAFDIASHVPPVRIWWGR
jgi:hypothetical protein